MPAVSHPSVPHFLGSMVDFTRGLREERWLIEHEQAERQHKIEQRYRQLVAFADVFLPMFRFINESGIDSHTLAGCHIAIGEAAFDLAQSLEEIQKIVEAEPDLLNYKDQAISLEKISEYLQDLEKALEPTRKDPLGWSKAQHAKIIDRIRRKEPVKAMPGLSETYARVKVKDLPE